MEMVNYGITENDIINYLNKHSKDEILKFKEALFVKFIKHQDIFSIEKIEMLANKINRTDINVSSVCDYHVDLGRIPSYVPSFSDYIKNQTLDTSGYLHILIPALGYYKPKTEELILTNGHIQKYLPFTLEMSECNKLTDTIENYNIAGKIHNLGDYFYGVDDINMSKNECSCMLEEYSKIYGNEEVEKIKKLVKEG